MKLSQFFPSPYLKGSDFEDEGPRVLTIKVVAEEEVGKDGEQKMVVRFLGEEKAWILNKTCWRAIEKVYGDTEDWPGKQIELFGAMVEYAGETQMGIRVRIPKSPPPAPKSPPISDDIPF